MRTGLPLDTQLFKPGLRLATAVSGGADSVTLLCALHARAPELGLVLSVAHLHHGLRGEEADADLAFVAALAARLNLPFHVHRVDTAAAAALHRQTIEEAARTLRYAWFRELMASAAVDAVATAHTLDDQAETVLAKLLRGAWTEGLSGIHPRLDFPEGHILRPLLATRRSEIESFLHSIRQPWREDSSNRHLAFTRNRIRHELLPQLESWNPRLREHLAQTATLARDEESWWQAEIARIAPQVLLTGRPVRGGGRAASEGVSLDLTRLAAQPPAIQRRLIRQAASLLGAAPDFPATESLRALALSGRAGQKSELASGLRAELTHRELRLAIQPAATPANHPATAPPPVEIPIPGEALIRDYALHIRIDLAPTPDPNAPQTTPPAAILRNWKPGDRVRLRHSGAPRKLKEVLERMKISGADRAFWPVLEIAGRIAWMRGAALEPTPGLRITADPLPPLPDPAPTLTPE